jgi:hypothetical protein
LPGEYHDRKYVGERAIDKKDELPPAMKDTTWIRNQEYALNTVELPSSSALQSASRVTALEAASPSPETSKTPESDLQSSADITALSASSLSLRTTNSDLAASGVSQKGNVGFDHSLSHESKRKNWPRKKTGRITTLPDERLKTPAEVREMCKDEVKKNPELFKPTIFTAVNFE